MDMSLTDLIPLDTLDSDGALRETADAVGGDTRAAFFRKAGVAGGGLLAGGAFMGAFPAISAASFPASDVAILNFALTLEYLEAAFYKEALAKGALTGLTLDFCKLVSAHETTHVATLKKVLGKKAVHSPKFDFMGTTADQGKFQQTSSALENTGVHAYLGQAAKIKTPALLTAAGTIVTIEARHAAAINLIITNDVNGKTGITPDGAFDVPFSKKKVLAAVKKTGFITG